MDVRVTDWEHIGPPPIWHRFNFWLGILFQCLKWEGLSISCWSWPSIHSHLKKNRGISLALVACPISDAPITCIPADYELLYRNAEVYAITYSFSLYNKYIVYFIMMYLFIWLYNSIISVNSLIYFVFDFM